MNAYDINGFLNSVSEAEQFNQTAALDLISSTFNHMIEKFGQSDNAAQILLEIDVEKHSLITLKGFLYSTKKYKDFMINRRIFSERVQQRVVREQGNLESILDVL